MKLVRKTYLLAATVLASATLFASPAMATDAITDASNQICAGGDINAVLAGLASFDDKVAALGDVARQSIAGTCPGSSADAAKAASDAVIAQAQAMVPADERSALKARLDKVYADQKGPDKPKTDAIASVSTYEGDEEGLPQTLVGTVAGDAASVD